MSYVPPPVPERWDVGKWDQAHWDGQLGLAIAAGTNTLTGSPAALTVGHVLQATIGAIALTGSTANLIYVPAAISYTLSAAPGAFNLIGNAANLIYVPVTVPGDKILTALQGSIVLSGQLATLHVTRFVPPETPQPGPMNFGRRVIHIPGRW